MKFERVELRFKKTIWFYALVPEGMTLKDAQTLADHVARTKMDQHEHDALWFADPLNRLDPVEIPDEDCRMTTRPALPWMKFAKPSVFQTQPLLVVSDDRDDFVAPEDAKWWLVSDEELAERRERERRLQDINHPDQMHLFPAASK